jgi:hypothetical protein
VLGVDHANIVEMLLGLLATGLRQHVVAVADERTCGRGLPGPFPVELHGLREPNSENRDAELCISVEHSRVKS